MTLLIILPVTMKYNKLLFVFDVITSTGRIFRCIPLTHIRIKHYHKFPKILNQIDDAQKLVFLTKYPFMFGKFIDELWRERTKILQSVLQP